MEALYSTSFPTPFGEKSISVFAEDILEFDEHIDILTTSAFIRDYDPLPKTVFGALDSIGISAEKLAADPEIDIRNLCNVWLSKDLSQIGTHIGRIGCVEMTVSEKREDQSARSEQDLLNSLKTYFRMLDIAGTYKIKMDTVAMPLLGSGKQKLSADLLIIPILNECMQFLKRNRHVKRIYFIEKSPKKAFSLAQMLQKSHALSQSPVITEEPKNKTDSLAFISYSSVDLHIAETVAQKLEDNGIKCWYAARDSRNNYAVAIASAIEKADRFILLLSKNSMKSEHVLNETDLAFKKLPDKIDFSPLLIDGAEMSPAFNYYLSRQNWIDVSAPPFEDRLEEFIKTIL